MKRHGHIFEKIISEENLRQAAATAAKAVGRRRDVDRFFLDEDKNIHALHQALASWSFSPSTPRTFIKHEPKVRVINTCPFYPDKIIEQAVVQVLDPLLVPVFVRDTYGSIKGRGCHLMARNIRKAMDRDRSGCRHALQADVLHAFQSVDHDILIATLRRKIKDEQALRLIRLLLNTPGIKIGGRMSQLFFNFLLSYFCHWLKEEKKVRYLFVYMDDILVLGDSKEQLHRLRADIAEYLDTNLHLQLKPNWQVYPVAVDRHDRHGRAIDITGFVIFLNQTRLRRRIKLNFIRRLAKLRKSDIPAADFRQAIAPWWGWLIHTDSSNLINKLQQTTRYEIQFSHKTRAAA